MKNLRFFIGGILLFTAVTTAVISCSENDTQATSEASNHNFMARGNLRGNFLNGNEWAYKKNDFNRLSIADKCDLWNEKVDQLLSLSLPTQHIDLIRQLKVELQNHKDGRAHQLGQVFSQIADITPDEDFIAMFFELKDYDYPNRFIGTGTASSRLRGYVTAQHYFFSAAPDSDTPCNCAYSCTAQTINPAVCYTSSCSPTMDGCGPFGMSECDGLVYICP